MRVKNTILFLIFSTFAMGSVYYTNPKYKRNPVWDYFTKNYNIIDVNGNEISTDKFDGKLVAFYFSASWCGTCKRVNKKIMDLRNKYSNIFDVVFISLDKDASSKRKEYFKKNFNYMIDMTYETARSNLKFFVKRGAMPSIVIFDPNHKLWVENFQDNLFQNPLNVKKTFDTIQTLKPKS